MRATMKVSIFKEKMALNTLQREEKISSRKKFNIVIESWKGCREPEVEILYRATKLLQNKLQ